MKPSDSVSETRRSSQDNYDDVDSLSDSSVEVFPILQTCHIKNSYFQSEKEVHFHSRLVITVGLYLPALDFVGYRSSDFDNLKSMT